MRGRQLSSRATLESSLRSRTGLRSVSFLPMQSPTPLHLRVLALKLIIRPVGIFSNLGTSKGRRQRRCRFRRPRGLCAPSCKERTQVSDSFLCVLSPADWPPCMHRFDRRSHRHYRLRLRRRARRPAFEWAPSPRRDHWLRLHGRYRCRDVLCGCEHGGEDLSRCRRPRRCEACAW